MDDELADRVAHRHTFGFIDAEFIPAGNPFQAFLKQPGGDEADRLVDAGASPAARAFMDGPDPLGILFFDGCLLIAELGKDLGKGGQTDP